MKCCANRLIIIFVVDIMRKLYLLPLFVLTGFFATAQVVVPVELHYSEISTQKGHFGDLNSISFNNAQNIYQFGSLPVYYFEVDLPAEGFGCEMEIKEIAVDTMSSEQSMLLTDNDLIDAEYAQIIEYVNNQARIYLLPFKRYNSSNNIIRLNKFDLRVDFVPIESQRSKPLHVPSYTSESVLNSGNWTKMGVTSTGIHKLTYQDIESMGINPSSMDINKIGVFGNYSGLLPEGNYEFRLDDLQENSISISGVEDGSFDEGDFILFYAQEPTVWKYVLFTGRYEHRNNIYSDTTYYFFTPDMGTAKPIEDLNGLENNATKFVNTFTDYAVHERDYENMMSTGKEWYGERFTGDTLTRVFNFSFPNRISSEPVYLDMEMIARSMLIDSYYDIYVNDELISDSSKIRFVSSSLGIYARETNDLMTFFTDGDEVNIKIKFYSDNENSIGWLDFIELNAERELVFNGGQLIFSNPQTSAVGNITEYEIGQAAGSNYVWDISDIHNPREVICRINDDNISFTLPTDTLKTFVVFDESEYYSPVSYKEILNQNLHGISWVNYVIVRPDEFAEEAELLANIHRFNDGLSTVCISPQQIYNEFSSGAQDITAIRDFMRMLYLKGAFGGEPAYLLFFGDASFDYKDRVHDNTNIIPTFESLESLRETGSFVTDDYFGLLDSDEGASATGILDIGIGRFPISTKEEAISTVKKIENYLAPNTSVMGDWRTNLCFVAHHRDNNLHLNQAEGLVAIADTLHDGIGINKIYLDAYPRVVVPGGYRFPDVNMKINEQMEEGALIVNYTGHGGLIGWADELVLDVPMINAFDNFDNMPLVITATCEFSRFDDPELTSAGEYLFLNKQGGAIALLTTTRLAYAHANYIVNRRIYTNLMESDYGGRPRLGDLVRLSKTPSHNNYLNFVLLGDPALTLAYPKYDLLTNENVTNKSGVNDTVHALSVVEVSGEIQDSHGQIIDDFNGYVYPKTVDKPSLYTTLGEAGNSYPEDFIMYDKVLFDGKAEVINGKFTFEFMVPKDIAYNYGYGKIRYYALDTVNFVDAWGAYNQLYLGGVDEDADIDDVGPEIELYLNSNSFNTKDVVTNSPVVLSYIKDDQGINSTGNGLGRDIVMILDNDYSSTMVMNEYFQMDLNSYKSGEVVYPFSELEQGWHTLTLKVWDLQNNSSEKTIEFLVDDNAEIQITQVLNYPNPFFDETQFDFVHDKSGAVLEAVIRIYNISGRLEVELESEATTAGGAPSPIIWDGRNGNGQEISPGIYVYTISISDNYGNVTVQQQKLFKINK